VADRVVLVTGGNRGIGLAVAQAFAAAGDRVAVTSRGGQVEDFLSLPCDITDATSVDAAIGRVEAEWGPIEILVANAGITDDKLVLQMDEASFAGVIDTNLVGTFRVVRRALPKMLRARKGRIVFLSSVVALTGSGGQVNYAASKAGLIGMARSLAREVGSRSITANVVAPGFVTTDMTAVLPEARKEEIVTNIPLKRMGRAEEVAGVIRWLASDAGAYVTGAVIPVDGGLGMGH
jgi:NAD(P)-dependent dehydrogenase (short-subunit alcohol dehydrogenase family)